MYPIEPGHKKGAPETSRQAAIEIASEAGTLRDRCIAILNGNPDGLTADEVAAKAGVSILAIRPRMSELRKLALIVDTGNRRPNDSGHNAVVWKSSVSASSSTSAPSPPQQKDTAHSLFDNTPIDHGMKAIKGF